MPSFSNYSNASAAQVQQQRIKSASTSTNATSVTRGQTALVHLSLSNTNAAARYFKFYDKATAPVVGTDVPIWTIPLPASSGYRMEPFDVPLGFVQGLAYAITTGVADSDTGQTTLDDVHGILTYEPGFVAGDLLFDDAGAAILDDNNVPIYA